MEKICAFVSLSSQAKPTIMALFAVFEVLYVNEFGSSPLENL